ncbi:MAG: hypothetical protein LBH44_10520 [Treponema sp.]|jgi:hypothetical protein|nr:hypothetical protein [Treponema sp.]
MKIILLSGNKSTGKTSTFHMLYDELTKGVKNPPKKIMEGGSRDFQCVLPYKGKKVALHSHGDLLYRVYYAPIIYSEVHYLILAHSKGGIYKNWIINLVKKKTKHAKHKLITKTVSNNKANYSTANMKDCLAIKAAIK